MLWNQLKTIALLGVLSALLIAIGSALGSGFFYLSVALAVGMNLFAYFHSDKLVLRMSGAREVSEAEAPELHRIVAELSQRAGLPKPKVCVAPDEQPNAFATGRSPEHGVVVVTQGIMRLLDWRELRGVLAHEIGHIKNRDVLLSTIAAMMAAAISSIGNMLAFGAMFGGRDDEEGGGGLLAAFLAPIAATLVQLGISRSREYMADETGAALSGDPESLARALEKLHAGAVHVPSTAAPATASLYIVNPFSGFGSRVLSMFSTHPPVEERVRRLRALAGTSNAQPRVRFRSFA